MANPVYWCKYIWYLQKQWNNATCNKIPCFGAGSDLDSGFFVSGTADFSRSLLFGSGFFSLDFFGAAFSSFLLSAAFGSAFFSTAGASFDFIGPLIKMNTLLQIGKWKNYCLKTDIGTIHRALAMDFY